MEIDQVLGTAPQPFLAGEEHRAQPLGRSRSDTAHAASSSIRRHWLKTTTLRFWVTTRLLTSSRNSLSLGVASDSMQLGRGRAQSQVRPSLVEVELSHPVEITRWVASKLISRRNSAWGERTTLAHGRELAMGRLSSSWACAARR